MPANEITINGVISYIVGDSKMPALIEWLDENGEKQESEKE